MKSAPFNGPFRVDAQLCSTSLSTFEGLWVPFGFALAGTAELAPGSTGATVAIIGTNQANPQNGVTLTVGGTVTTGDVLNVAVAGPNVAGGSAQISYTAKAGDTTATIAAALAAAINVATLPPAPSSFTPPLYRVGGSASVSGSVITFGWPSAGEGQAPEFQNPSSPPPANPLVLSYTQGGNSETITVASVGAAGGGISIAALTTAAPGPIVLTPLPVRWIKARVTALSGGSAVVNAIGVTP